MPNQHGLVGPKSGFDKHLFLAHLSADTRKLFKQIQILNTVSSTNDNCLAGNCDLCIAQQQTSGRGRRGKNWHSPATGNLYMSLLRTVHTNLSPSLSLVIALAICRACERLKLPAIKIKWPNDLLWEGRKLAGILVETSQPPLRSPDLPSAQLANRTPHQLQVVIGVGINISSTNLNQKTTTSVAEVCASCAVELPAREIIAATVLEQICRLLADYVQGNCPAWQQQWLKRAWNLHHEVAIVGKNKRHLGVMRGIGSAGELQLETAQGIKLFDSSEFSLRFLANK